MKLNGECKESIVRRLRGSEHGQSITLMMIAIVGILGATAFVIDVGRVYFGYQELQASVQAAALAGGAALSAAPSTDSQSQAVTYISNIATSYSAVQSVGNLNATSNLLQNVTISFTPKCLNTLTGQGILCTASPASANALRVTETAQVPTTFARVLGFDTWTISATATASARGGFNGPYNVEIIVDTTSSMNDTDSDSQCNSSRISCALQGVQILLSTLSPCAAGLASCGSASTSSVNVATPASGTETAYNVPKPVDEVGLMVFPGMTKASYNADDFTCPPTNPPITSYNGYFNPSNCTANGVPAACCTGRGLGTCGTTTATPPIYDIVPLSSNFRTSDTAAVNTAADLVIAGGGGSNCGVAAPGGEGTFYAGVIDSAQANLVANARPNTKNVMILISDGAANATSSEGMKYPTTAPSWKYPLANQCQQAVTRAQAAAAAGTIIYSVAYGAEAGTNQCNDTSPTMTPCETMEGIASSPENFFSDYTAKGSDSSCISASSPTSNLNQIFTEIAQDLTVSRLIPNNMN